MITSNHEPALGASEIDLTPFFASIHSYVSLAEQVPLARLPQLVNAYFDACATEIQAEGGTIDKFVGDAVVAMFGAPSRMQDHALHACVAALRCHSRIEELRARL